MTNSLVAILILVLVPARGFAQNPTNAPTPNVEAGRPARIVALGQMQWPIAVDGRHRFAAVNLRLIQSPPKARGGHPVLIGAGVGAGAGFVLNATACRTGESVCTAPGNLLMAGIGAGIGALVGALISRR